MIGPLVEIHNATTATGQAALLGFVGVPAQSRVQAGEAAVIAAAVARLGQMFGPPATRPTASLNKERAADPLTATPDDLVAADHPSPVARPWIEGE